VSRPRSRRAARRTALLALYQSDVTGADARAVLESDSKEEPPVDRYATELVDGVVGARTELDAKIGDAAEGWSVERLAALDRAILRLATYELLHRKDVPVGAAIDEAVSAANELSTEASGRFVNGVLGRIAREESRRGNGSGETGASG
jgi:N utilization substance protein B